MRRRDFIKVVASSAVTWPLAARAQQHSMPVVGFLNSGSAAGYTPFVSAFGEGLKEAGFIDGNNVTIEYRWARAKMIGCRQWRPISCAME
jgi:putative ABC transport system substrate-binding protein